MSETHPANHEFDQPRGFYAYDVPMHRMHDEASCTVTRLQAVLEAFLPQYRGSLQPGDLDDKIGYIAGKGSSLLGPDSLLLDEGFTIHEYIPDDYVEQAAGILNHGLDYFLEHIDKFGKDEEEVRLLFPPERVAAIQSEYAKEGDFIIDRYPSYIQTKGSSATQDAIIGALHDNSLIGVTTGKNGLFHAELIVGHAFSDDFQRLLCKSPEFDRESAGMVSEDATKTFRGEGRIRWEKGYKIFRHPEYQLQLLQQ